MADPLSQAAEEFAPAPQYFFDTEQSGNIMARYSNARRRFDEQGAIQQRESQRLSMEQDVLRAQREQERMERDRLLADRDDLDYEEKQQARGERGQFLSDLNKSIDPRDPDFNKSVVEFMQNLPPALQEDKTIVDILDMKRREHDDYRNQEFRREELQARHRNELEKFRLRQQSMAGLKGVPPEMIKQYTLPDGTIDPALYYEAGKMERTLDEETDESRVQRRKEAAKELASGRLSAREAATIYIKDDEAFPSKLEELRQQAIRDNPQLAKALADDKRFQKKFPDLYRKGKEWDDDRLAKELNLAKRFDDPDDYISLRGSLSPEAREARQRVWEVANNQAGEKSEKATPDTADTAEPDTPELDYDIVTQGGQKYKVYADGSYEKL